MSQALAEAWNGGGSTSGVFLLIGMGAMFLFTIVNKSLIESLDPPLDDFESFRLYLTLVVVWLGFAAIAIGTNGWGAGMMQVAGFVVGCGLTRLLVRFVMQPYLIE